jgi:protein-lysine N-methyltransferase EEF2KMT
MACVTNLFVVKFMPHHPVILVNKSILELGSGTGFLGLIVADIQISHGGVTGCPILYLTDVNEDVLRQCSENTQLPCSKRSAWVVDLQLSYSQTHLTVTETCLSNH